MISKMEKDMNVLISQCDNTSKISIPSIFTLFGDLASDHAPQLGLGSDVLAKKDLFWVAVRTKIKVHRRPLMTEAFKASTWPEAPGRVRCVRYYTLTKGNELLAEGKTEWAIVNLTSGRPHKISEIYPDNLEHISDTVCNDSFSKISEDFSDCELLGNINVHSTDIDIGQHMNNAAYIRALFGLFTCAQLEKMAVSDAEINFRTPCYEGEKLDVFIRSCNDAYELGIVRPDGKIAATVRFA